MKKILFVYPHNFFESNMGTNIRVYSLAKELFLEGYQIDLYACSNFISSFATFDTQNKEGIIRNLFLYDFRKTVLYRKKNKIRRFISKVFNRVELSSWVTPAMNRQFSEIVSSTQYDFIVMFYAYTGELVSPDNYKGDANKIYFMEDFLSVNHFTSGKKKYFGSEVNSEVSRIAHFDKVVCISWDEKVFFEKLLSDRQFYYLPHVINSKKICDKPLNAKKRVLFIGYDNEYNIQGINWFLDSVYGCLTDNVEIVIAGKVSTCVKTECSNLRKINFVADLDKLYRDIDIVICPLLNGTGMKIKVIEAMSYSIPVVCTCRGVDGFPDKLKNGCLVADTPRKFADAINLLISHNEYYQECQRKVRDYFADTFDWNVTRDTMMDVFDATDVSGTTC